MTRRSPGFSRLSSLAPIPPPQLSTLNSQLSTLNLPRLMLKLITDYFQNPSRPSGEKCWSEKRSLLRNELFMATFPDDSIYSNDGPCSTNRLASSTV
jgi:hypothetical protein